MNAPPGSEVIVKVGAEGGSITLYGARIPAGWVFNREVMDQTPELLDESRINHTSSRVDSWTAALELLDQYPWYRLYPLKVHKEFRAAVLRAVEERAQRSTGRSRLSEWRALCELSGDGDSVR